MWETIRHEYKAKVALALFLFYTFWFVIIHLLLPSDHFLYHYYGVFYGIIAVWGGIWGIVIARKWGGFKSIMGKALLLFSFGLFAQEFGQIAYSYYIFVLHVDIPYPSIGDIGFFGTIPFYIYGAYLLGKASGVRFTLNSLQNKLQALLIPALMVAVAYILFLRYYSFDLSTPLETFLTYGYPLGQAVYISLGILTYSLTRGLLGGVMKSKVLFLILAFGAQFLADYAFLYFQELYYPGSPIDYLYTLAYFLMAIGIMQFETAYNKLRHTE